MRIKCGVTTRKRRKKILKQAKGYFGAKKNLYKKANEQWMRSMMYAYRDRKKRKTIFRQLWIVRINAALKQFDISYSLFINLLKQKKIELNRKMLSLLAIENPEAFSKLITIVKK